MFLHNRSNCSFLIIKLKYIFYILDCTTKQFNNCCNINMYLLYYTTVKARVKITYIDEILEAFNSVWDFFSSNNFHHAKLPFNTSCNIALNVRAVFNNKTPSNAAVIVLVS